MFCVYIYLHIVITFSSNLRIPYEPTTDADDIDGGGLHILPESGCTSNALPVETVPQAATPSCSNEVAIRSSLVKVQKSMLDYAPLDDKGSKKCTLAVTKFLATGMQPYSLVDEEPFREMVKTLNPRYIMPGRKYFSNTAIPKLYLDAVEKLKGMLPKSNEHLSLTCDCWTSLAGQPYLAITAHFIDSNWNLISACLNCCYFDENHSAENIKKIIQNKLEEWGLLLQSVVSCTTDNGANVISAAELLKITRIPCFAHSINIGVNRCIEVPQIKKAVARLKSLQNAIAHSWKMKRDLHEAQKLLECEVKNLPSACPTRWWSTLKLCQRFLTNQLPLCKMLQNFSNQKHLMPEGNEVSGIESFIQVVSVLENVTENLSGETFVTSSSVLPLIRQIKKNVKPNSDDTVLLKTLKEKILHSLERYDEVPLKEILQKSTFLDPRFRLYFFDDDVKDSVKKLVSNELKALHSKTNFVPLLNSPPRKRKKGLSALLDYGDSLSDNTKDQSEIEIERYLSLPKIGLDDDPLEWWKNYSSSFPSLSILSKKYLSMQGSSVPSERVFSKGGNVVNKKRCTLSPKNAEMQIFLAYNKKILGL